MIRLGVIGMGNRLSNMLTKMYELYPEIRVVGIVDPAEEGARARTPEKDRKDVVFYKTLDAMVRRAAPDGLLVGTRCNLHAPYAVKASGYDIPLFLEKPIAVSMRQAIAVERAFSQSKCEVVVSFPMRISPLCGMVKSLLDRKSTGTCEHVMAFNYVPYGTCYWADGYRDFAITQGLFLQKATHDFDYLQYLLDSPIVRVAAMANYGRVFGGNKPPGLTCLKCPDADRCPEHPCNLRRNGMAADIKDKFCVFSTDCGSPESGINEDCSSALLEFSSGAHGIYTQVFFARRDAATRGATISGYKGTVTFDWYTNELRYVRHHEPFTDTVKAQGGLSHFGGDQELVHDYIRVIQGRGTSRTPITAGLASIYACLAAKKSAETGGFVKVRQLGQAIYTKGVMSTPPRP